MVPTFAWEEHATLTLPLRTAGRLVEGLKCSSGGEVMDYRNLWKQETNA